MGMYVMRMAFWDSGEGFGWKAREVEVEERGKRHDGVSRSKVNDIGTLFRKIHLLMVWSFSPLETFTSTHVAK